PITRIRILPRANPVPTYCEGTGNTSPVDFAFDTLLFARPSQQPTVGPFITVSQESSPGAGDFDHHVLGVMLPWRSPAAQQLSAAQLYRYNVDVATGAYPGRVRSFGLQILPLTADRSNMYLAETTDGLTLFTVHNSAPIVRQGFTGSSAGHAEMQFDIS